MYVQCVHEKRETATRKGKERGKASEYHVLGSNQRLLQTITTEELSPLRLPLALVEASHALCSMPPTLPNRITQCIFPCRPPISVDGPSGASATHRLDTSNVLVSSCDKRAYVPCLKLLLTVWAGLQTINILPDDVLLHIFHFDRLAYLEGWRPSWTWNRLVHVCRRWRSLIFASPKFLDLKLVCGPRTRVGLTDIWPPLPIIIGVNPGMLMPQNYDFGAALMHHNRVCEVNLRLTYTQLQQLASAMRVQFPALERLTLRGVLCYQTPPPLPVLPDGFLGCSAPRLQSLMLESIPLPALPKFLMSTTDLINLHLVDIPNSRSISPEAIVTSLSALTSLKRLSLGFRCLPSHPSQEIRRPPPPTRTVLPALTRFEFKGASKYLEDLVSWIDAPLLVYIYMTFVEFISDSGVPQLAQFVRRTANFNALNEASLVFDFNYGVRIDSPLLTQTFDEKSGLRILCKGWHLQPLSLVPVCTSVEHLYIYEAQSLAPPLKFVVNTGWLAFFHKFTGVKYLYLSNVFAPKIAPALQELVGGRITEVLPTLQNIFLEKQPLGRGIPEGIGKFIAARQLSGRPISISLWERREDLEWDSIREVDE
jgi:hypothetical protein